MNDSLAMLSRQQIREVDEVAIRDYGMSGLVLMENAGGGAARWIASTFADRPDVKILCGRGNNGGDGYVMARHLETLGFRVSILSLVEAESLSQDAATNAYIAKLAGITLLQINERKDLEQALFAGDLVVDCMLGTGAKGAPRGLFASAIEIANQLKGPRIAIDIPTGLDCDTGEQALPTFRADATLTFVASKKGFSKASAATALGEVVVIPIGVPHALLEKLGV